MSRKLAKNGHHSIAMGEYFRQFYANKDALSRRRSTFRNKSIASPLRSITYEAIQRSKAMPPLNPVNLRVGLLLAGVRVLCQLVVPVLHCPGLLRALRLFVCPILFLSSRIRRSL